METLLLSRKALRSIQNYLHLVGGVNSQLVHLKKKIRKNENRKILFHKHAESNVQSRTIYHNKSNKSKIQKVLSGLFMRGRELNSSLDVRCTRGSRLQ